MIFPFQSVLSCTDVREHNCLNNNIYSILISSVLREILTNVRQKSILSDERHIGITLPCVQIFKQKASPTSTGVNYSIHFNLLNMTQSYQHSVSEVLNVFSTKQHDNNKSLKSTPLNFTSSTSYVSHPPRCESQQTHSFIFVPAH